MFHRSLALTLATCFVLSGCGSQTGATLMSASAGAPAQPPADAPTVGVMQTAAAPSVRLQPGGKPLTTTIQVLGADDMTDEELSDDAEAVGFSIMSTAVGKTGFIRRTASGWALETTSGIFKKTTVGYVLTGTTGVLTQLQARENKKSKITGTLDDGGTKIEVSTVAAALDLGKLTNWFTKGKFDGIVKDAYSRLPVGYATVEATAKNGGYVYSAVANGGGEFAIRCLEPGDYTLSVTCAGYQAKTSDVTTLRARKKVHVGLDLAANP